MLISSSIRFTFFFVISLFAGWTFRAEATTIERQIEPVMGCAVRVSGLITDGAAGRLRNLLETIDPLTDGGMFESKRWNSGNHGFRVCFDSPGGSLTEGIKMARVIKELYFGTAVPEGAICESACAIAFMAGMQMTESDYEGAPSLVDRVLHPKGVLGFHAPSLSISDGTYNKKVVSSAYAIALKSVSEILDLIEEIRIDFPQSLLREMLATPPEQMLRVDTVEQAIKWGINAAPTRFSGLPLMVIFEEKCGKYGGGSQDIDEFYSQIELTFIDERSDPHYPEISVRLAVPTGFGMEFSNPCYVVFSLSGTREKYLSDQMGFMGIRGGTYPFATYPAKTRLSSLPAPDFSADMALIESFRGNQNLKVEFESCWLSSPVVRVSNVNEYVNLRSQPDFSARIIREIPLGEQARPMRYENLTVIGGDQNRQSCVKACQAFSANRDDSTARDRALECIEDNMLWYKITDARGNRGWVSRKFLEEDK